MSNHNRISRLGARLSRWNDRHSNHDRRAEASARYRLLDRLAGRLYVWGEGGPTRS